MEEKKRPTLSLIASKLGVSTSTVSLALKAHHSIPEATRKKVLAMAEEVGYQHDANLSRLMSYLRHSHRRREHPLIAYVTNTPRAAYWRENAYNAQLHEGLIRRADFLGYRIEEFWLSSAKGGYRMNSLPRVLRARGIEAVILDPHLAGGLIDLDMSGFACAAICERDVTDPPIHRATLYREQTVYETLLHLHGVGYRRIGFVARWPEEGQPIDCLPFVSGFLTYQEMQLRPDEHIPCFRSHGEMDWDEKAARKWVLEYRPDLILMLDFRILKTLEGLNLRFPEDIAVAYADWTPEQAPMAGIWQRREHTAAHALELVDAQLRRNEGGYPEVPKVVFVKGEWRPGPTVSEPAP